MNNKNKVFVFNMGFNKFLNFLFYLLLIILILYPSNILLTESLQLMIIDNPFYQYLGKHRGMFAFPVSFLIFFYFVYYFTKKKLIFNNDSKYLYFFVSYFILYIIFAIVGIQESNIWLEPTTYLDKSAYIKPSIDIRLFKNIFNVCLLIFFIICFSNLKFKNNYLIYKLYNFTLCFFCLANLANLILYYNSSTIYFSPEGYLSSYLNLYITHYMDYFPYLIFMSLALDFYFYTKDRIITLFFLIIKLFWILTTNFYAIELYGEIINKGYMISILFFLLSISLLPFLKDIITKNKILMLIIFINIFYLLYIISPLSAYEPSLKDRAQIFYYFFQDINIFNIFLPTSLKYNFQHNLHNDFWDLYFGLSIFFLIFYNFMSKTFYLIHKKNHYSFLIIFSIFCVGSLVQNNILNIYLIINFSFITCLMQINDKLNQENY